MFLATELTLLAAALLWAITGQGSLETPILIASCGCFFHLKILDRSIVNSRLSQFWIDVLEAVSFGILAATALFYFFPALAPTTGAALAGALMAILLPVILRPVLRQLVSHRMLVEGVLIVGTGDLVGKLYRALTASGDLQEDGNSASQVLSFPRNPLDPRVTANLADLDQMVERNGISHVIVAEQDSQSRGKLAAALVDSRLRGLDVSDAVDFYEAQCGKIWVEGLSSEWFVYTKGFRHSRMARLCKRSIDVIFALLLLVVTAPLMAIIAIAIKLDSPGRVLFRQVRVGLHERPFTIFKFRSMRADAESATGPVWTSAADHRVTRVGAWLRKFRLDEIPQAINVLRGEMSLVGPRPERPYFVERLVEQIPYYNLRHYAKPGITGWAQVMYSYGASIEDAYQKLQYDFYYAKHASVVFDARILFKTVKIVLFGRGR